MVKNLELEKQTEIVTIDGLFDDFSDSTLTANQFTENPNNTSGQTWVVSGGEMAASGGVSNGGDGAMYQNRNYHCPAKGQPFPLYLDVTFEVRLKVTDHSPWEAGVSYSTADLSTFNDYRLGLRNSGSPNTTGIWYTYPGFSNTIEVSLVANQYYKLKMRIEHNQALTGTTIAYYYISIWLDGVLYLNRHQVERETFAGHRLDGIGGLLAMTAGATTACTVTFDYWCCNRLEYPIEIKATKTTLFKLGRANIKALNKRFELLQKIGQGSLLAIYARNTVIDGFIRKWIGLIDESIPHPKLKDSIIIITATHISKLLGQRHFSAVFTARTTDYIIKDGTNGIMVKAPEFTTNNVIQGNRTLNKKYVKRDLRYIILRLAAEENFLPYVDDLNDLHHEPTGSQASGIIIDLTTKNLLDWSFEDISAQLYNSVEVYGTDIYFELKGADTKRFEGDERVKLIVNPEIISSSDAEREALTYLASHDIVQIGTIKNLTDYNLNIGTSVRVDVPDKALGAIKKDMIIIEIEDDYLRRIQTLIVADNNNDIADILFEQFVQTEKVDLRNVDESAEDKTKTVFTSEDVWIWCDFEIEVDTGGGYISYHTGKATILNRDMAVLCSLLANNLAAPTYSAGRIQSYRMKIGTGISIPKITDTALQTDISVDKDITGNFITDSGGDIYKPLTFEWLTGDANGNNLSEFGFVPNHDWGIETNRDRFEYATTPDWSPYNVATQLFVRGTFPPFPKTSSDKIKITIKMRADMNFKRQARG